MFLNHYLESLMMDKLSEFNQGIEKLKDISTPHVATMNFPTPEFPNPDFSTMNFSTPDFSTWG